MAPVRQRFLAGLLRLGDCRTSSLFRGSNSGFLYVHPVLNHFSRSSIETFIGVKYSLTPCLRQKRRVIRPICHSTTCLTESRPPSLTLVSRAWKSSEAQRQSLLLQQTSKIQKASSSPCLMRASSMARVSLLSCHTQCYITHPH